MPATRFFAMLRGARYMRAYLFSELCDIACIPMQSTRYYQGLKRVYQSQIERDDTSRSTRSAPVQRKGLDGEDAKNLMMDLFYRLKRARA